MTGLVRLLRLDARLLLGRPLFRTITIAAVSAAIVAAATSGGQPGAGWWRVAQSVRVIIPLLLCFGGILGAVSISGDAASGSLRGVLTRPVARGAVVASRAIVLCAGIAAVYGLSVLVASFVAWATDTFPSITYGGEAGAPDLVSRAELLAVVPGLVAAAIPALLCATLLGVAIGALWNDPSSATICALVLVLTPYVVETVFGIETRWSITHAATFSTAILSDLAEGVTTRLPAAEDSWALVSGGVWPLLAGVTALALGGAVFSIRDFRA